MAVATPVEPMLKSQPDVTKLTTFTGWTATVTKHLAPRNTPGQMVVPTGQFTLKQVLEMQLTVPLQHGPGFYQFRVSDAGGTGDDAWMVKSAGAEEASPMSNVTPIGPTFPSAQPPLGEGVVHLGHGFYFNPEMGTLTTPWRTVHNWKQGDPMPVQPTTASTAQQPAATPWWSQGMPTGQFGQQPPWSSYPVNDASSETTRLREQLAEEKRARETAETRAAIQKVADDAARRADETSRMLAAAIEKLGAKPATDPALERMERELAETKRLAADREREDRFRAELKAQQEKTDAILRDLTANKSDPMLPLLMQIMTTQAASATQAVEAIRESVATATAASERQTQAMAAQLAGSTMKPAELLSIVQASRAEGGTFARDMATSTREMMATQKEFYAGMLDVAGQAGQPAWVGLLQTAMDKVGAVGAAIAERQQSAPPPQPQPQLQRAPQPQQQQRPQAPQPQQRVAPPPQPPRLGPESPADERERLAGTVPHLQSAPGTAVHAVPLNGAAGAAVPVVAPLAGAASPAVTVIAPARRNARRKPPKRGGRRAPPPPPPGVPHTGEQLRHVDPVVLRESLSDKPDEWLFGPLLPHVMQLRGAIGMLKPDQIATYVLQGRDEMSASGLMPPALELLFFDQHMVLVERLLPEAPLEYRESVIEQLATLLAGAEGVTEEDDDEEEDETEEDETGDEPAA